MLRNPLETTACIEGGMDMVAVWTLWSGQNECSKGEKLAAASQQVCPQLRTTAQLVWASK